MEISREGRFKTLPAESHFPRVASSINSGWCGAREERGDVAAAGRKDRSQMGSWAKRRCCWDPGKEEELGWIRKQQNPGFIPCLALCSVRFCVGPHP